MNQSYEDIRSRIPEPPVWFDEHAVPRYCEFSTYHVADIYADEAALVRIACQGCGRPFDVAFSTSAVARILCDKPGFKLAENIVSKTLHYGDPPNVGCCAAGPTMNSEPRRVLEFWAREGVDWVKKPELEMDIAPEWVSADD